LVLLPPSIDINAISEALSSLRLYTDKGQALEGDWPGSSRDRSTRAGKPHDHEKARGQSSTTFHLNPSVGEIHADLPTHHTQAIIEVFATTKTAFSTSSDEDDDSWAGADFSALDNIGALRCFVGVCNYLLDGDDSDNGDNELTWPCARRQRLHTTSTFHDRYITTLPPIQDLLSCF
jgi:hypothetical protein